MMMSVPDSRFARALLRLNALHRELVRRLLDGEEDDADESLALRYGTTTDVIRVERFLARQRLAEELALLDIPQG